MSKKFKKVTKNRLNAIHNAGTMISNLDFECELTDKDIEEHQIIGNLLIEHSKEVLKLLIKLQ